MAVYDFRLRDVAGGADVLAGSMDSYEFTTLWFIRFDETTGTRIAHSGTQTSWNWVIVSPAGVPFDGVTVPGNGAKKVTINFVAAIPNQVLNRVEEVEFTQAWCRIIKGQHVLAYSRSAITNVTITPSDP